MVEVTFSFNLFTFCVHIFRKITDARRAKHDVRHHIALIQEYLTEGKLDVLHDYLNEYSKSLPDNSLVRFCENTAANAILLYFAQQAKDKYSAK